MYNKILKYIKNIEEKTYKTMLKCFRYCFITTILSAFILLYYILNPISPSVFEIGILLFRTSIIFFSFTFACGLWMDNVKKQAI